MPSPEYMAAIRSVQTFKDEAQTLAMQDFRKEAIELLNEMGIETFAWRQYTPYFNDGDACVFSVYADDPIVNGADYDNDKEADPPLPAGFPKYPTATWEEIKEMSLFEKEKHNAMCEAAREPYKKIAGFIYQWQEEDLLFMFGDHVKVTVTKDEIKSESCEHD